MGIIADRGGDTPLFQGPEMSRKLDVLRAHCAAEGRDPYEHAAETLEECFRTGSIAASCTCG